MSKRPNIQALADEAFTRDAGSVHPIRAIMNDEDTGRILFVPLEQLAANPDQPRKEFDPQAHDDLTASVREHGILQPVIARKNPDGEGFILIAGERRTRAAKAAGLTEIPALIRSPKDHLEIAIIENLQRENLSAIEEAEALKKLKEAKSYTGRELAKIIGKSEQSVSESLALTGLPDPIKAELRTSVTVPKSQLLEVVRAGSAEQVAAAWTALKTGQTRTVRELRHAKNPTAEKASPYIHTYRPESGRFRVTVAFQKKRASRDEIREALEEALNEL